MESNVPDKFGRGWWPFALAGLVISLLYATHLFYCQRSTLKLLDLFLPNMDMRANLLWAMGIREQGWLNAAPYHPWTLWQQAIAPGPQWIQWWGGEKIFQQSPLYAYFLSLFVRNFLLVRVLQAFMSIATCGFIGLLTARIANPTAGWIAFWLAAFYAPFYVYSWPFLRDGLAWLIIAATLWALSELTHSDWSSDRARLFAWLVGMLMGLGFLARETYLLLIPIVWLTLVCLTWRSRQWGIVMRVSIAIVFAIFPLVLRNWIVNAPLLSTSNRAAEVFILGNAATSGASVFTIPAETKQIFYQSQGKFLPAVAATVSSHPDGVLGWLRLQLKRALSLFDPYESPDNISFYFVAEISPVVRFGLRYWMILPLGLAGFVLSLWRAERAHLWMWIFLSVFWLSLFIGTAVSRYRQPLMLFFIPWAAYFLRIVWGFVSRREFRAAAYCGVAVLFGWVLILGPLSRQPREQYIRPAEYIGSAAVLRLLGQEQQARAMLDFVRQKFPGTLPPSVR